MSVLVLCLLTTAADVAIAQQSVSTAMFRNGSDHAGVYVDPAASMYNGILWRKQTLGAVRSSPTIANGIVFIGSSDGYFYALDSETGHENWKFRVGRAVASSAAVSEGSVFFSSYGNAFYALRVTDGKLLWRTQFGSDLPRSYDDTSKQSITYNGEFLVSSAAVLGDTAVVGAGDGFLYALDSKSGRIRWKFRTGGRIRSSPAVSDGIVYVASYDGSVYAIQFKSGKQLWRYDTKGRTLNSRDVGFDRRSILSSPAVADGVVYLGSRDSHLYAIDAHTGMLKWSYDYEKDGMTWVVSSPAVRDGIVYVGTADGHFAQALRAQDGHELWRFETSSRVWSSLAIAGRNLYMADQSGTLYAVDLSLGKETWRFEARSGIQSSPVVAKGILYFGSNDGGVYALRIDGTQPMRRAVYFDEATTRLWESVGLSVKMADQTAFRDFFQARGYELLNAAQLDDWLQKRIVDRIPSVVIFCTPTLPETTTGSDPARGLFRRYLDSGGKAVSISYYPLMLPKLIFDENHNLTAMTINWEYAQHLVSVSYEGGLQDETNNNRVTADGRDWGLPEFWIGTWDTPLSPNVTPLSLDDRGFAGSWVRNYGAGPGTGFVYLGLEKWDINMLNSLATVAEFHPRRVHKSRRP